MIKSFTRYQEYRKCKRLWVFKSLGYEPIQKPDALVTGTMVHTGISAHLRGQDWMKAVDAEYKAALKRLNLIEDTTGRMKAQESMSKNLIRANDLITRYASSWLTDYSATIVEPEIQFSNAVAHPDLLCTYHDMRVIVDIKTGKLADSSYYDLSGQVDFYAWMLEEKYNEHISLVIYDLVGDDNIYRHERPPRLKEGMRYWARIETMPELPDLSQLDRVEASLEYTCPNRCDFFQPCQLLTTDSIGACIEYLDRNYWKEEEGLEA